MFWLKLAYGLSLFILLYGFAGYAFLMWVVTVSKKKNKLKVLPTTIEWPAVTLLVAAFDEMEVIVQKIHNTLELDYPANRLQFIFITDGSTDGTDTVIKNFPQIQLLHQPQRKGKAAAINRAMPYVTTPYVVFSDANTMLNKEAIKLLMLHYSNSRVGAVSGEKKIASDPAFKKATSGEGVYWRYESLIKKLEYRFYSLVGAAGELFSIRTALFKPIPENYILDDFFTALAIVQQGYIVAYEPGAMATEMASASMAEEKKRKVRIAAGGYQLAFRFPGLLNPFIHPAFSFQYFSHKILRWYVVPPALCVLLVTGILVAGEGWVFHYLFYAQILFYTLALGGWLFRKKSTGTSFLFLPYYFLFMNYCMVLGWFQWRAGKQNVLWPKAVRQSIP